MPAIGYGNYMIGVEKSVNGYRTKAYRFFVANTKSRREPGAGGCSPTAPPSCALESGKRLFFGQYC